jgi:two-component sensor histidine kinase
MIKGEPIHILLVEDDPAHSEAVRRALKAAGMNVVVREAGTLRAYRELAAAHQPDIAILDLSLPDGRAPEVLISPPEAGPFPIVVMSSQGDEQKAVEAMKAGALDYIVKSPEAFAGMPRTVERVLHEWGMLQERKRAEEAVQVSLREKEILLREIHHRVKNNLQVISSLFNLQAGYIKDKEALRILKEGQTRIRSMALVHEKLYQSGNLSKIDLAGYIQSLSAHLFHVYLVDPNQVRLETEYGDVTLDINSAVPCGLILNELISNALKHAFPAGRKGVLTIRLRRGKDGAVELRIADNGVGFPKGLDFRRTESLGLQIVSLLVGQLEGTIKLDGKNGTAFTVAFHETKRGLRT